MFQLIVQCRDEAICVVDVSKAVREDAKRNKAVIYHCAISVGCQKFGSQS
jgi:hypothetical protein